MYKLSDTVERKFIDSIDLDEWEIETDTGFRPISAIHKTIEYEEWIIQTKTGKKLIAADTHIIFDENLNEIFVKDCIVNKTKIITRDGNELVISLEKTNISSNMFDITVDNENHRFWSGDILSHNSTTTCGFILWYILFNKEKTVALLANRGDTAREILSKIQLAYQHLPKWIQQGVMTWNKGLFELENNSRVVATATSSNNIRGYTVNLLFIDEAAFVENWDDFFTSVFPTISSGSSTKIVLVSTPKGMNHFYKIYQNALEKRNNYNLITVKWQDVPGRDEAWKQDTLSAMNFDTEKFDQEYSVNFMGSSGTLIAGWKLKELIHQTPITKKEGLSLYNMPIANRTYVCVVDVSRGKGLDYSAFSIVDVSKMPYEQVCCYKNNMVTPIDYVEVIYRVAKSYNSAAVLVEINDIGEQVSTSLHYDFEYDNILFTESAGRLGKRITTGFGANIDRGIRTTKTVKSVGCSILKLLVEQNQLILHDFDTILELSTFAKKGVSYEAESGKHDDMVMGLVLFAWLSDQAYFKDITDINTLARLRDKTEDQIISDMMPFGFVDNGEELFDPSSEPLAVRNWMVDDLDTNW